jgi:hypothetical protein
LRTAKSRVSAGDLLDRALSHTNDKLRRKFDGVAAVALGLQAGFPATQLVEALGDDGEVCLEDGIVEPDQEVAGLHLRIVLHQDMADDAAARVLHLLGITRGHDHAGRDQRAGNVGGGGPAADAAIE